MVKLRVRFILFPDVQDMWALFSESSWLSASITPMSIPKDALGTPVGPKQTSKTTYNNPPLGKIAMGSPPKPFRLNGCVGELRRTTKDINVLVLFMHLVSFVLSYNS